MAKTLDTVTGKVEIITKEKESNYGLFRSVLFIDTESPAYKDSRDLDDAYKYWMNFAPDDYDQIPKKGEVVTLAHNGKNWVIVGGQNTASDRPQTTQTNQTSSSKPTQTKDEKRAAIAAYAVRMAKLRHFCWKTIEAEFTDIELTHDDKRAMSVGLLMDVDKAFNLKEILGED